MINSLAQHVPWRRLMRKMTIRFCLRLAAGFKNGEANIYDRTKHHWMPVAFDTQGQIVAKMKLAVSIVVPPRQFDPTNLPK